MPFSRGDPHPAMSADARLGALGLRPVTGWVPRDPPSEPDLSSPVPVLHRPGEPGLAASRRPTGGELGAPVPDVAGLAGLLRAAVVDRLPAVLRGSRVELSRAALAGISLVCVVAVGFALVGFLRVRHAAAAAEDLPPPPVAVSAMPTALGGVVVDVAGRVRRPGLVTLPPGARVADALRAAGGALRASDVALLNLARRLVDGEQLLVGVQPPPGAAVGGNAGSGPAAGAGAGTAGSPLDLNAASLDQLDGLPGVGPVLAQRILDWRTAHNGFTSVDQLRQVAGIGGRKFDQLRDLVRV